MDLVHLWNQRNGYQTQLVQLQQHLDSTDLRIQEVQGSFKKIPALSLSVFWSIEAESPLCFYESWRPARILAPTRRTPAF
jgi:hypothetical protein